MQEFIKKLIERLEEKIEITWKHDYFGGRKDAFKEAIEIINQLAEEYKHSCLCYLGIPFEYQNEEAKLPASEFADDNGWIPCNERLPEETECYLVTWRDRVTCKNYVEIIEYDSGSQEWLDCICQAGLLGYDIIAWQTIPKPYQPKGEHNEK